MGYTLPVSPLGSEVRDISFKETPEIHEQKKMCCVNYSAFGTWRTFGMDRNTTEEGKVAGKGESTGKHLVTNPE